MRSTNRRILRALVGTPHSRPLFAAIAVLANVPLSLSAHAGFLAGPSTFSGTGNTYYLLPNSLWDTAERKAVAMGGHLASVQSLAENDWIYDNFTAFGGVNRNLWIGGYRVGNSGNTWAWTDGSAWSYTNWDAPAEPSNNSNNEDFVHLFGPAWTSTQRREWNDLPNLWWISNNGDRGIMNGVVEIVTPINVGNPATASTGNWVPNADGFWHMPTNWSGNAVPDGVDAVAQLRIGSTADRRIIYLSSNRTVGTLSFADIDATPATDFTVSGSSVLTLAKNGAQPELNSDARDVQLEVELAGNRGFRKTGQGSLWLEDGNPQLTGPIEVEAGWLAVRMANALGNDASTVRVRNGAILSFNYTRDVTLADTLLLNGEGPSATSTLLSNIGLYGAFYVGTNINLTVPAVVLESSSKITVEDDNADFIISALSGAGDLIKSEEGKVHLSNSNPTFSGKVRFSPRPNALTGDTGEIVIASEACLGPNPTAFTSNQLSLDYGGAIEANVSLTIDDPNRGIRVGDGVSQANGQFDGGGFRPNGTTTMIVASKITSPAGAGTLEKSGTGTLVLNGDLSGFSGSIAVQAGTISLVSPASILQLQVASGSTLRITGDGTPSFSGLEAKALSVVGSGKIDLGKSGIRYDYASGGTSPLATVLADIIAGRIITSQAGKVVGFGEASTLGRSSFLGRPVDDTTVILLATIKGDATLDGIVNFDDLLLLAQSYGQVGSWVNGDFDRTGIVNFDDLLSLAQSYGSSVWVVPGASPEFNADWQLAQSIVPEPAAFALAMPAMGVLSRRLRRG